MAKPNFNFIKRQKELEKKKKKEEPKKVDGEPGAAAEGAPKKKAEPPEAAPANEVPPADEPPAGDNPETIKKKPGGCGCHVPGNSPHDVAYGSLLLVAAGLAMARRRRGLPS